jgi:hypothetical protein
MEWLVDQIFSRCPAVDLRRDNSTIVPGQVIRLQDFRFIPSNPVMLVPESNITDIDSHSEETTGNESDTDHDEIAGNADLTGVE